MSDRYRSDITGIEHSTVPLGFYYGEVQIISVEVGFSVPMHSDIATDVLCGRAIEEVTTAKRQRKEERLTAVINGEETKCVFNECFLTFGQHDLKPGMRNRLSKVHFPYSKNMRPFMLQVLPNSSPVAMTCVQSVC